MKKLFYLLIPVLFLFACNNNQKAKEEVAKEEKCEQVENKECSGEHKKCEGMCVAKLMEDPSAFVDKEVVVGGMCTHICDHSGRNIFIASPENEEVVIIGKTAEGVDPFDKALEGKKVKVKGILRAQEVNAEPEVHHDVEVKYFVEVAEVKECTCKGHEGGEGCTHAESKDACKGHKEGEGCKHAEGKDGCKGHKEGEGCPSKKA